MTTDVQLPAMDGQQDDAPESVIYPQFPDNPNNHLYTISMDGRGPMIVVRGNTPEEINERYQALMDAGTTSVAAAVFSHMKAEMNVAQGLGPVSAVPAPQGPPAPALPPQGQFPVPQQQFNQQPVQQFPGAPGTAPAAWQNAGAPAGGDPDNTPEYRQAGWYKLTVGFGGPKAAFDGLVKQYGMRKGRPSEGGQVSFNKANKSWHVAPEAVQAFAQFSPVPA